MIQTIINHKSEIRRLHVLPLQDEELDILRPRQRPPLIEWLENNYILEGGTAAIEGPWSREYTPYFVEPAEWLSDSTTRELWIRACSQGGKTTFGTGFVGYIAAVSPGPTLLIMPTKPDVQNRVEARIRPMFRANEDLLRHVRGRERNIYIGKQTVMDHMNLYIGWPTTAQALADKPVCYIEADEVGKFPAFVGPEADPISLMRKRQRWFKGRSKLLAMSTPVTMDDLEDQNWKRGDCCELWVPCAHCGQWHQLGWFRGENEYNVVIEKTTKGDWYSEGTYARGLHCWYECPHCHAHWTEDDRWKAVQAGKWVPGSLALDARGNLVGQLLPMTYRSIRIHALMLHPMVETVSGLVAEFVTAVKARAAGNIQPYKDFWNSQLARPWQEKKAITEIEVLNRHVGSYPKGKVPPGVQMATAGIDVQLDHCYIAVLGWGYLGQWWSLFEERIETGPTDRLENLKKLEPYLAMRFELLEDPSLVMRIALAAIDRQYNSETVDAFCCHYAGMLPIIPVMGDDRLNKQPWRVGAAAGGRLKRYDLNVTMYKDALYRGYFEAIAAGPGYGHLHRETEYWVLEQLTSETKEIERHGERIVWIGWKQKPGRANHLWDCSVYARAAAEIRGLWTLADPSAPKQEAPKPPGRPVGRRPIRTKY